MSKCGARSALLSRRDVLRRARPFNAASHAADLESERDGGRNRRQASNPIPTLLAPLFSAKRGALNWLADRPGLSVCWVSNEARVAELADALDSGFHFWCFQGASSRFKKNSKTIDFIG